jgi:hypothetical protein
VQELFRGYVQGHGALRDQPNCNYKVEEVVPRSYLIGMAVYREIEVLLDWLMDHKKRKTVPLDVVESFMTRVVDILPRELRKLQLMDEKMMLLEKK